MYGCGIGPIYSKRNRARTTKVMNRYVDAITLRDPDSMKELEVLGVTKPKIALSADTTVSLPPAPEDVVDGILDSVGIPVHGNYIGFVLRPWPSFEEKAKVIAAAADYAYETYGYTPVFFPIEPRLDVSAAQRVIQRMHAPHYLFTEAYTAAQTIGILSRMKVVVSMRLHGLIFAGSQGVPLVGIVYDQKVSSFLSYIGQDLYEDLNKLSEEKLKVLIDGAISRGKNPRLLSESVEKLRRMDQINRELLEQYAAPQAYSPPRETPFLRTRKGVLIGFLTLQFPPVLPSASPEKQNHAQQDQAPQEDCLAAWGYRYCLVPQIYRPEIVGPVKQKASRQHPNHQEQWNGLEEHGHILPAVLGEEHRHSSGCHPQQENHPHQHQQILAIGAVKPGIIVTAPVEQRAIPKPERSLPYKGDGIQNYIAQRQHHRPAEAGGQLNLPNPPPGARGPLNRSGVIEAVPHKGR